MAKSQDSFNKKEREKKKQKKKQEKNERKEERKALKGKSLESEFSYVDEYGNYSSTPPDPSKREEINLEDIAISTPKQTNTQKPDLTRTGRLTFFNEGKGFGFIKDDQTQESVFVHVNNMIDRVGENAKVSFRTEKGPKGLSAVEVRAIE